MKHKRGADHEWDVRRYIGDMAYYAVCRCGWYYACGDALHKDEPWLLYRYCPNCGARKKRYNPNVRKMNKEIWDLYAKRERSAND